MSSLRPAGCMRLRRAMNAAQHKIVNLLKASWDFFVITCHNVFHVWPKTTLLLPVWPETPKGWTPLSQIQLWVLPLSHCPPSAQTQLPSIFKYFLLCHPLVYFYVYNILSHTYMPLNKILMFLFGGFVQFFKLFIYSITLNHPIVIRHILMKADPCKL